MFKTRREINPASFRDPSGFIFHRDGVIYRQINPVYQKDYDHLMTSGLYQNLCEKKWLLPHEEMNIEPCTEPAYRIVKPEQIPIITYPYEWCFSQLKDAALLTLAIEKEALRFDMSLKDSSAYNIQFYKGAPTLIDLLSFEQYHEGAPWAAYKQFCQHFLAPLFLMKYRDLRCGRFLNLFLDGVPLDLASSLLPRGTWLYPSSFLHIHLHARMGSRYAQGAAKVKTMSVSRFNLMALIDNLEQIIKTLSLKKGRTEWSHYYDDLHYIPKAFMHKKEIVQKYLHQARPSKVWDLGANTGIFSTLATEAKAEVVAFDIDALAVEKHYLQCKKNGEIHILPLVLDLSNPSSGAGWAHEERTSLKERGPVDMVLSLALIHHLAISNNLPFYKIAHFFSQLGKQLIIEFVPKEDPKVQQLLSARQDIFSEYTQEHFELAFAQFFHIVEQQRLSDSTRILYLMHRK